MGRRSWLVYLARLIQKLPLSLLRIIESPLLKLSRSANSHSSVVILLALPRSGSTLTYQALIHGLNPVYLSNLGNTLYQLPLLGGILSSIRCKRYKSDFRSNQGFVNGLCGPAEGLRFWSYWLGSGLDDSHPITFKPKKLLRNARYINMVFSFLSRPNHPIITGYLGHTLFIKQLCNIFPEVIFIRLDRDPLSNALSILNCRKKEISNWFSVFPKECIQYQHAELHEQVAAQVYWLNQRIDSQITTKNTIHVSYEKLCTDPNKELNRIAMFCNSKGLKLKQLNLLPKTFKYKKEIDKSDPDIIKLLIAFKKLENTHGKLRNSSTQ